MKNRHVNSLLIAVALLVCDAGAKAQDLVFSGRVVGISPNAGTMVLSDEANVKVTLSGLQVAQIRAVDGRVVAWGNLRPGVNVSVAYMRHGRQWVLPRILIPNEAQPEFVPVISDKRYLSLFDGDITTNPGSKAGVDNDITTKPDGIANRDRDITTKSDR